MLFTGHNHKIHIFKNDDYTYCGLEKFWIGSIGHWCCYPSKKQIRRYKQIICKRCLKLSLKNE